MVLYILTLKKDSGPNGSKHSLRETINISIFVGESLRNNTITAQYSIYLLFISRCLFSNSDYIASNIRVITN
jgi:hypothetical protein